MNHTVKFLPADRIIAVPAGTAIGEAARLAEITSLHLPCGGRGTCGKCTVLMAVGDAQPQEVLACRTVVNENVTIFVPEATRHSADSIVADSTIGHIDSRSEDFSPLCRAVSVTVPEPTAGVNLSDLQRLEQALGPFAESRISCSRTILQQLAAALRRENGLISTLITRGASVVELNAIVPGAAPPPAYGIACDIGTTTVALRLVNLITGEIEASAADYNAQCSRGADIISRIDYARTTERLEELRTMAVETINRLISNVLDRAEVDGEDVYDMVISGNCTMVHFFLGLPPRYIRESPYVPTVNHVPPMRATDCSLRINPDAVILFAPGVGSYVGGDITAGLQCTDMGTSADSISLFVDIGTNGEIVIGNSEFLLTCACSAGPAFEGSGIGCGMRADEGAIDSFIIDPATGAVDYTVIGDALPRGVCGSGMISLLGELLSAGYIDRSGRFTGEVDPGRNRVVEGTRGLRLIDACATAHGKDIIITEADIDNLIRTKAAIYAACDLLLRNAGLDFATIERVYIAGGFGKYIDIEAAIRIGLFPDIERSRFSYLGNTSLAGATRTLLSERYRALLDELPGRMTYIDLSNEPKYMDAYVAALFLPHTELDRFPGAV